MKKTLYVMSGVPFSDREVNSDDLHKEGDAVKISVSQHLNWIQDALPQLTRREAQNQTYSFVYSSIMENKHRDVILCDTNLKLNYRKQIYERFKNDFHIHVMQVERDLEEVLEDNAVSENPINEDILMKLYYSLEKPQIDVDCDSYAIIDNNYKLEIEKIKEEKEEVYSMDYGFLSDLFETGVLIVHRNGKVGTGVRYSDVSHAVVRQGQEFLLSDLVDFETGLGSAEYGLNRGNDIVEIYGLPTQAQGLFSESVEDRDLLWGGNELPLLTDDEYTILFHLNDEAREAVLVSIDKGVYLAMRDNADGTVFVPMLFDGMFVDFLEGTEGYIVNELVYFYEEAQGFRD